MRKRIKLASSGRLVNSKIYHLLSYIHGYCCCGFTDSSKPYFLSSIIMSLGWKSLSLILKLKSWKLRKGFPGNSDGKESAAAQETWVQSLGREDPLEKEMATHSSILAWEIPWAEEPGRLQSMGSQRVGYNWTASLHFTSNSGNCD